MLASAPKWLPEGLLVLALLGGGCAGAPTTDAPAPNPDTSSAGAEADAGADQPRKTACPDVPKPNEERVAACEAKSGQLLGRETDGCVRGYECVLP